MKDIIVVSLNPAIDRNYTVAEFMPGKLFRCENPTVSPGGKGVNVARIISVLGGNVTLTGFFAGNNGQFIIDNLIKNKVNVLPVFTDGETRSSINILDKVSGTETEILEQGPIVTEENIKSLKINLFNLLNESSNETVVVLSGGLPEGVSEDIYHELILELKSRCALCFLDSSSESLIRGVDACPFFVKPNLREFGQIVKSLKSETDYGFIDEINLDNILNVDNISIIYDIYKTLNINNLIITLSAKGALLFSGNEVLYMNPPEITPVNTIGSGDCFTAGFVYAFSKDFSSIECLKIAGACGASNALIEQVGVIDLKKVNEFIKNIEIEEKLNLLDE